ncbi:MAG: trehalose-6-phosphate synthase [Nitrospirota bacterium]
MRITFRLIVSLVVIVTVVVTIFSFVQTRQEKARLSDELERRSAILAESLQETVEPLMGKGSSARLQKIVDKFGNRERLSGLAIYDAQGQPLAITPSLAGRLAHPPDAVAGVFEQARKGGFDVFDDKKVHLYGVPLQQDGQLTGALVIVHDADYIGARLSEMWRHNFLRLLLQASLISIAALLIIRWSIVGPIAKAADWMKKLRMGEASEPFAFLKADLFAPLTREITVMAKNLQMAREAAEEEARLREAAESVWTPERLKEHLRARLDGRPLFVVSNREPYMHVRKGSRIDTIVPASGLVTALEPVLRACDGTWIAHGSGDADMEMTDLQGRLRVPPEDPRYTLRRVWLTKQEENGYYYGFANEGLWPLCHIAHTRPTFRADDWAQYESVNRKFADVVCEELEGTTEPCVLIQDYHFALLPRLIKEKRPDARVAIFWHIPWPNPESFGICPWQRELLQGILGADLIGFHIQFHCNNFLETVDRTLESRVDWERFTVDREGHTSWVKPFPISIGLHEPSASPPDGEASRAALLKDCGVTARFVGVGVDRIDYTKGIIERFLGIERFLEKYPQYQGQFTFFELGSPSRTLIKRYHDLVGEVEAVVDRINWRFKTKDWMPIVFLKKHHSHGEIRSFYKAADVCLVTSLHDGMNLVAKEFVAARTDEQGALILSQFTGASRELRDALLINPYDTEQIADAIRYALEMEPRKQQERMRRLREALKTHNVYRWTANLVRELSQIRLEEEAYAATNRPQ